MKAKKRSPRRITRAQRERKAVTRIMAALREVQAAVNEYLDATRKPTPYPSPDLRRRRR